MRRSRLLFYEDAYLREAKARVLEVRGQEVYLDSTIFFAEAGGQEGDRGWINDIEVVKVRPDDYAHILAAEPSFSPGDEVTLRLDWERRYRLMRLHSATHLVCIAVQDLLKTEIIGSHVSPDHARVDIAFEGSVKPHLPQISEFVNDLVRRDLPIEIFWRGETRIWRLLNWEIPCCGLHVRKTGEIGEISLKRRNLGRGKERIEIRVRP